MLWAGHTGGLELRKRASGAMALAGRFPYGETAVLSDGGRSGRPRKERFAPRAFGFRVDDPAAQIHLLIGHDYGKPLASRSAGTLKLVDSDDALTFDAEISPELQEVSFVRDFLGSLAAGLVGGISPGFRLPPKRRVAKPEIIKDEGMDPENGAFNAIVRTVLSALIYEISVVTQPAYDKTQIEARSWQPDVTAFVPSPRNRWRL